MAESKIQITLIVDDTPFLWSMSQCCHRAAEIFHHERYLLLALQIDALLYKRLVHRGLAALFEVE